MATPHAPTTVTREQLYEQVWNTSIRQLAKTYGISDVGLGKACERHQVPRPPVGYWAKKAVGKAPPRPPLPDLIEPKLQTITLTPTPPAQRETRASAAGRATGANTERAQAQPAEQAEG